ncbi:MAG: undecaprenyl diphosphate synthase family protein, partial [Acidobacteriota bacterium]|nr:undecaprenyl diphosphate synthase family protein [Acidobacteriota bacterium]
MTNDAAAGRIHAAIIMDGNGRWALCRGLPRVEGHSAGARSISAVVRAAPRLGIGTLTLFAFAANNWSRPEAEVLSLMEIFEGFFRTETGKWREEGVRVSVIGRRDRIPPSLREA